MVQVSMTEAKAQWYRLVARAAAGEEITITKYGRPHAKLIAYEQRQRSRNG